MPGRWSLDDPRFANLWGPGPAARDDGDRDPAGVMRHDTATIQRTSPDDITESVIRRFDACPDPRLREIMQASSPTCTASPPRSG